MIVDAAAVDEGKNPLEREASHARATGVGQIAHRAGPASVRLKGHFAVSLLPTRATRAPTV